MLQYIQHWYLNFCPLSPQPLTFLMCIPSCSVFGLCCPHVSNVLRLLLPEGFLHVSPIVQITLPPDYSITTSLLQVSTYVRSESSRSWSMFFVCRRPGFNPLYHMILEHYQEWSVSNELGVAQSIARYSLKINSLLKGHILKIWRKRNPFHCWWKHKLI